jgi:hypothetical protein
MRALQSARPIKFWYYLIPGLITQLRQSDLEPILFDRVVKTIGLLDAKRPGWATEINLKNLNLGDPYQSIAGQLYGSLDEALKSLGIPRREDSGLWLDPHLGHFQFQLSQLQTLWNKAVKYRQEGVLLPKRGF